MRELKFRAWHDGGKYPEEDVMFYDYPHRVFKWLNEGQPVTIMQFTGLKDKNGVDIYEGDIVQDEEHYYSAIYWDNDDSMYVASDVGGLADMCFPIKVIGNIYENPELLESK